MAFEKLVEDNWKASTYAPSESKARSNLAYRFKKNTNRVPNAKITLPGKIVLIGNERGNKHG
jgi:hypothetical protein